MTTEPIPEAAVEAAKAVIVAKDIEFCGDEEYPPTLTDIGAQEMARAALEAAAPALRRQGAVTALREEAEKAAALADSLHQTIAGMPGRSDCTVDDINRYSGMAGEADAFARRLRARADEMEVGK